MKNIGFSSFLFSLIMFGSIQTGFSIESGDKLPEMHLDKYELNDCSSDSTKSDLDFESLRTSINVQAETKKYDSEYFDSERRIYIAQEAKGLFRGASFVFKHDRKLAFGSVSCEEISSEPEIFQQYFVYRLSCGGYKKNSDIDATLILNTEEGKVVFVEIDERKAGNSFGPLRFNKKKSAFGKVSCKDKDLDSKTLQRLILGKSGYEKLQETQRDLQDALRANGASF